MKNFKKFIESKETKSIKQYNEDSGDCLEDDGGYVLVYQEHYYINVEEYDKMGYDGRKMYYLTLGNQSESNDNLKVLELKLYQWFVDNIDGSDGWLYNVGVHNPNTTPLYYVVFKDMGFDVEDVSYGNDECDCLRLSMNGKAIYDVYLPNSANKDWDNSKFNTFHILRLDDNDDRIENDLDNNKSLQEIIDYIEEDLHQQARDVMGEMNEIVSKSYKNIPQLSLDEYLIEYGSLFSSQDRTPLLTKAKRIESYFGELKPLCKSTIYGSEPSQMFDDGLESKEEYNEYLFVLDFNIGEAFRYRITPQMRGDNDCEWYEEFMDSQNHRVKDCQWMVSTNKMLTKIENY